MDTVQKIDTNLLVEAVREELKLRELGAGFYADSRGTKERSIHAQHGAVHCFGAIQDDFPADIANTFSFSGVQNEHHSCMILTCLNLMGVKPPDSLLRFFAPVDQEELKRWLQAHDWSTTHKRFYGTLPRIVDKDTLPEGWLETLFGAVDAQFDRWLSVKKIKLSRLFQKNSKLAKWETISKLYHILLMHMFAERPFPRQKELMDILNALDWETDGTYATNCTDFDYAMLIQHLPYAASDKSARLNTIMDRKIEQFEERLGDMKNQNNHHIACSLFDIAVFQRLLPDRFQGPQLRDVLHEKALFSV
jgi:hypothetical protein